MPLAIQAESLTKVYKVGRRTTIHALDNVTLDVRQGEIFALLGANGAGKTTLLKILMGLVFPTTGDARISGRSVSDPRSRSEVGYLPEQAFVPQRMTLPEFLRLSGNLSGVSASGMLDRIDELIEQVGLSEFRSMAMKKYSKGMLRLGGLAQSLVNSPRILLLDEPSDGLDPRARAGLRELLRQLRNNGVSVFLSSHVLNEVEMVADRAAIIKKGRLVKIGTIGELTATRNQYAVKICGILSEDLRKLLSRHPVHDRDGYTTIEAASLDELNALLDQLRAAALQIESSGPVRTSLEDSFLTLTGDGEIQQA